MAFGGEVDDGAWLLLIENARDERLIADVAVHEAMRRRLARILRQAIQAIEITQIAGVGQRIQVDHLPGMASKPVLDEVGADEPGAAGDEDHSTC